MHSGHCFKTCKLRFHFKLSTKWISLIIVGKVTGSASLQFPTYEIYKRIPCNCKIPYKHTSVQESSPAWTQEAYRPRRIKYSICYPVLGGVPPPVGVPPRPGLTPWGTPQPGLTRRVPEVGFPHQGTPCWGTPSWGTPHFGVPPSGYPLVVPPGQVWRGVPEVGCPHWGTPHRGNPPPLKCGLTNKVKLLPSLSYYVRGR